MSHSSLLVIVPTTGEQELLSEELRARIARQPALRLCGFGPIAAAARIMQLLCELRPDRVLLVGLAGRLGRSLQLGHAYHFQEVACYGIGAGSGAQFQSLGEMGWKHWSEPELSVGDSIPLIRFSDSTTRVQTTADTLLTTCAASASESDVAERLARWPSAVAEDMEGFAVALACQLAGNVPLEIIRGISNDAGDRTQANWQMRPAMQAASRLALQCIEHALDS